MERLFPIFFTGKVPVLDFFTGQLIKEADRLGMDYHVCGWDDEESRTSEAFHGFLKRKGAFFFTFNNVGIKLLEDGENLWEKYNVPVFSMLVDHPRNFEDALLEPVQGLHLICPDRRHPEYAEEFYPGLSSVSFMPHGGTPSVSPLPYETRPIDLLYTGSCQPEIANRPVVTVFRDGGADFFEQTIQLLFSEPSLTTEEAIRIYIQATAYSITPGDPLLRQLNEKVAGYIEAVVRRFYKQAFLRMLDRAGIRAEVYGSGWEASDYTFGENIRFHPWTTSEECNALAGQAKLLLNFLPWFKDGCSERVFNNMLGGGVCLTDESPYLRERFTDGKELVFFSLNNLPQAVADISWLLAHPKDASHIAERGFFTARDADTWGCRFHTLCAMAKAVIYPESGE